MFPDLRKTIVGSFMETVQARFVRLCIILTLLGWGLPVHTRFDDLDLVSKRVSESETANCVLDSCQS